MIAAGLRNCCAMSRNCRSTTGCHDRSDPCDHLDSVQTTCCRQATRSQGQLRRRVWERNGSALGDLSGCGDSCRPTSGELGTSANGKKPASPLANARRSAQSPVEFYAGQISLHLACHDAGKCFPPVNRVALLARSEKPSGKCVVKVWTPRRETDIRLTTKA